MPGKSENTPKARALGAELRECRAEAGLTQQQLAEQIGVSYVSISRYETGTRTPKPEDVAQILATLGVTGDRYASLVEMSKGADQPNWLDTGQGIRKELTRLIEFERTATEITDVATSVIPGLLQTADYARSVMAATPTDEVEPYVAMRVGRREVLTKRNPVSFTAFIAETALRERIGGPEIALDQLHHLEKMAKLDNIAVFVLPAVSERWHPAHAGSFSFYTFAKTSPIVHLEHYASGVFLYDDSDVGPYQDALTTLREVAMSRNHSARTIAEIVSELEGAAP
ncbi:helix-turn-helix transcriptional regulator [Saccharopolyspora sp. NFXS83]|uniref:helix-turn-helix domain-containing protein n=1 Tax=Saccharopolyspora sp. NFXS83 TaxID=2993560 RepID=UPI00224B1CC8|nr:helix-turn-helix transcriptional regulator [Saccharopolyspora sp. NFXS83]MCX2728696.1 helix-turn-helix transcriptional regulator [Saccharopolyspora sp. NFXS83]